MRAAAATRPATGACALASAMELWRWTLRHLIDSRDAEGRPLYRDQRQGVTFPMADALSWLLAARAQILDVMELARRAEEDEASEGLAGSAALLADLCHVQAARAAGEAARIATELVHGYNRHPTWDEADCDCWRADDIEALESVMGGIAACARGLTDVIDEDGSHPAKAGPCVRLAGLEPFERRRAKLDGCLTGARLAKDRAAKALTTVMIPEALDYPA
jgi:hypothetical protein